MTATTTTTTTKIQSSRGADGGVTKDIAILYYMNIVVKFIQTSIDG